MLAAGTVAHGGLRSDPTGWGEMGSCRTQWVTGLFVARPMVFAEPWLPQGAMCSAASPQPLPPGHPSCSMGSSQPSCHQAVPATPLLQKGKWGWFWHKAHCRGDFGGQGPKYKWKKAVSGDTG